MLTHAARRHVRVVYRVLHGSVRVRVSCRPSHTTKGGAAEPFEFATGVGRGVLVWFTQQHRLDAHPAPTNRCKA